MAPSHCFHAPDDFEAVWERFKKIARREGKSAGVLIRDFVIRYVDIHDPGNPQARITSYAEGGPVDIAIVEGRIREHFRSRAEAQGLDIGYRDIVERCRQDITDVKAALAMAQRVTVWLHRRGVKVWR